MSRESHVSTFTICTLSPLHQSLNNSVVPSFSQIHVLLVDLATFCAIGACQVDCMGGDICCSHTLVHSLLSYNYPTAILDSIDTHMGTHHAITDWGGGGGGVDSVCL